MNAVQCISWIHFTALTSLWGCWTRWRNGETSKVKLTHGIPTHAASWCIHTQSTQARAHDRTKAAPCVCRAMSVVCLQFRQNAQCHLLPSLRSSSVSGRRAAGTVATWLDRTFPGGWPPPRPPSCNSNNAPQPRWCHWTPGHSPDYAICEQRWCPIQCVFMFHVSCQASFTMSAIGFG